MATRLVKMTREKAIQRATRLGPRLAISMDCRLGSLSANCLAKRLAIRSVKCWGFRWGVWSAPAKARLSEPASDTRFAKS